MTAPALGTIAARGITNKKDAINVSEEIDEDIFEVGWNSWNPNVGNVKGHVKFLMKIQFLNREGVLKSTTKLVSYRALEFGQDGHRDKKVNLFASKFS